MKTFIDQLDKHIREEGIPFKQIVIPSNNLPTYINYAILQRLNEHLDCKDMFWPDFYTLEYDDQNRLFLRAVSYNKRNNILIYGNNDYYCTGLSTKKNTISDLDLYDYALILKHFESLRKSVYDKIDEYAKGKMSLHEINEIRYKAMHDFYEARFRELGNKIRIVCSLEEELEESINKIISYIDYLNRLYQEDQEAYRDERLVYISYTEREDKEQKPRTYTGINSKKPRKNPVISMDERREALEKYEYTYFGVATATNTFKKDYFCYLYKDFEGRNILILEPYCGTKYTKVVYLNTRDLSKEEFRDLCTKVLELTNDETLDYPNILRLGHTTMEVFANKLSFILDNVNEVKCKESLKKRVKSSRNPETEEDE